MFKKKPRNLESSLRYNIHTGHTVINNIYTSYIYINETGLGRWALDMYIPVYLKYRKTIYWLLTKGAGCGYIGRAYRAAADSAPCSYRAAPCTQVHISDSVRLTGATGGR